MSGDDHSARRLGGQEPAAAIRTRTAGAAATLATAGRTPRLAVVLATRDEPAARYVAKAAAAVGIICDVVDLEPGASADDIRRTLGRLAADSAVRGVMLQTPLPPGVEFTEVATAIDPTKDVDGANRRASAASPRDCLPSRPPPRPRCWPSWSTTSSRLPVDRR
jgi:methylenetetrahydrofolate dehydrogenase (NADP+)/methenyltetrahydrofolate cyclohydrolase